MVIKFQATSDEAIERFLDTTQLPEDAGSFIVSHTYVYYSFMQNTQADAQEFIDQIVDLGFTVIGEV